MTSQYDPQLQFVLLDMHSLVAASRPRLMILSVTRIHVTVRAYRVRNIDGDRSEGCCHLANG